MTGVETVSKLINETVNAAAFKQTLVESETKAVLLVIASTQGTVGAGEFLPQDLANTEENAPVVIIVVRPTPTAAENVSALLARYRGDDPKAGTPPPEPGAPRKKWFW